MESRRTQTLHTTNGSNAYDVIAQPSVQTSKRFARGQEVHKLEEKLCEYVGVPYCNVVASGTSGLLLALRAAGVGSGDTVLCTAFGFFATADVIALTGARPLFVDINPNTYNVDPYCLDYVLGKCIRTGIKLPKALVAVDLFGLPCEFDELEEICLRYGITLIEEMAQAFGATYCGQKAGSFGRFSVASFYPSRPLGGMGEGGAVFSHTPLDSGMLAKLHRNGGGRRFLKDGDIVLDDGAKLGSVQADLLTEKLTQFDSEHTRRQKVAARYRHHFNGKVKMQRIGKEYESANTHFIISLKDSNQRAGLIEYLREKQIPSYVYHPSPLRMTAACNDWNRVTLVNTMAIASKILSLPIHPYLSNGVVDYICEQVLTFLKTR